MNLEYYKRDGIQYYNNRPVPQVATRPGTMTYKIMRTLDETMSLYELAEATGIAVKRIHTPLAKLLRCGRIIRIKHGRTPYYAKADAMGGE